jgi:hypothetical protein
LPSRHEIESFDKLYINGLEIETLAGDGNVTSIIDENGSSSGRYNDYIRIKKHLGADSQTADADLVSEVAEWTTNHRLRGISYLYVRMKFKQEVYPNGIPEITADIKGKKVYNPATTLTAWSDNPALCVRDYLTSSYGLSDISANIDDTLVTTAANACDRTASNADTWFTMNGAFNTSAVPADILNTLLSTMGGTLWFSQGKWRMRAAIWEAPTLTLDEDDLRGPLSVNTRHSRRDNFNVIKGTFSGPETQWFPSDYPEYKVAQAITDDGGIESVVDLNLPFTDNADECQRVARIVYERNRQQLTVKGNFGLRAFDLQVGDVVRLDNVRLGFDNTNIKYFEVVDWNFAASVGEIIVSLTLRETSSSVFDEIDSYATFELDNTSLSSPFDVQTVTYGTPQTSAPINRDGTVIPEILFNWSVDNSDEVDYYIFSYKKSGDSIYTSINVSDTYYRLSAAISGVTYNYAIQAVNHKGVRSTFTAASVSTVNDSVAPSAPTGLIATGGYQNVVLDWINPTDYDFAYVEVYRVEGSDVLVGTVSGTSFVDGGRDNETLYTYKLKAVDFSGNKSSFTATQSATTIAEVSGPPGAAGSRGAGWWRYVDTTNASTYYDTDTQSRVNAAFSTAVGLAIVEGDRFIISCTDDTAIAFIYSSGSWVAQEAFVDGNLLVDGTITGQKVAAATIESDKISVGSLSAITATMGQLDVTDFIRIDTEGAAFLAGRDGSSDISQDGFYIGRETFDGSLGFEVSHISEDENGDISGIIHNNNGFKVYNPKLTTGGSFSSTNVYLYSNGSSHNLGSGLTEVTFTAIGAGGGGGNSFANGSSAETLSNAGADVYFDSLTGWTTAAGTPIVAGGYLEIQNAEIRRSFTTTSGRSYVLILDHFTASSNVTINIGTTDGGSEVASYVLSNETYQTELRRAFVSTAGTLYLSIDDNSTTGQKTMMDTIHVHETNYHGGDTTVKVWAGSVGGTLIATKTSLGGPGGRTALPPAWGGTINSEAGQNSTWGDGGPAVDRNTDGANATGYSAGGGGAGGDNYDLFDNQLGYAGKGGRKGSEATFVVDTSAHVGSDIIIEADVVGAGGAVGTLHTWQGGSGSPGFVIVQSPIGQTIEYSIGNLVPKFTPIATQTLASSAIAATYTWTDLSAYEIISVEYNMTLDVASSVTIEARQTGGTWRTLRTQSTTTSDDTAYMKFDIMYFNSTHRKAFYVLSAEITNNDFSGSTGGAETSERYMPWNSTGTAEAFSEIRVTHPALDPINGDTWNSYIRISGVKKANGQFPWSID